MRAAAVVVYIAAATLIASVVLVTRLQNPDMSETRLWIEYWPRYVATIGAAAAAIWFGSWAESR
jgi:hypothetical protein